MTVTYRSAPKFLTHEKAVIPLPPQFLEALFDYVKYLGHSSIKNDTKSESNTHYRKFEQSCKNVSDYGLHVNDDLASNKFYDRGFL